MGRKLLCRDLTRIGNIIFRSAKLMIKDEILEEVAKGNLYSSNTTSLLIYILPEEDRHL